MIEPDDSFRPEGVPVEAWDEYTRLLRHASYGVMQPGHLWRLWELRETYPQLEADARKPPPPGRG